jgi:competence protein ComEC
MKKLSIKFKYKNWIIVFIIWFLVYFFIKKNDLVNVLEKSLPSREAGLLTGMVWGEKGGMSKDFYTLLKNSGLVHMVVVSGANLMIIGKSFIENLAKIVGRKMAIMGGGGIILLYVNLVGWQIPVIRAVLFLGIYYWSQMLGRSFYPWRAILFVGWLMILADIGVLKDVSFWLSMSAFVAVVLNQKRGVLMNTIWVSIFVLPILSLCFGKISLMTPLTNILVLFLVELLTVLGFLGSVLGLLWFDLGKILVSICYPFLRYLIEIVEFLGSTGGVVKFQFNWPMLIGWYLLVGGYWYGKEKK